MNEWMIKQMNWIKLGKLYAIPLFIIEKKKNKMIFFNSAFFSFSFISLHKYQVNKRKKKVEKE